MCPSVGPDALGHRGHARNLGGKPHRDASTSLACTPYQIQHTLLCGICGLGLHQPVGDARIGTPGMQQAFDRCHLFAPLVGRSAWHDRLLIPAQTAGDLLQRSGFPLKRQEFGQCCHV